MTVPLKEPLEQRHCQKCGYLVPVPRWNERSRCPECGEKLALHELTGLPPRGRVTQWCHTATELAPGVVRLLLAGALIVAILGLVWVIFGPGISD